MRRIAFYLLIAGATCLAGCAHSGAISKSPCACDFHLIGQQA
jgi:hypothetical protein